MAQLFFGNKKNDEVIEDPDDEIQMFAQAINGHLDDRKSGGDPFYSHRSYKSGTFMYNEDMKSFADGNNARKCPHCHKVIDDEPVDDGPLTTRRSYNHKPIEGLKAPQRVKAQFEMEQEFGIRPNPESFYVMCKFH